jgi:hypothetical protein
MRQTAYDRASDQKISQGFERRNGPDERQREIFLYGGAAMRVTDQEPACSHKGNEPALT